MQQIRQKLSNAVFGFRFAIVDGTRKERDCRSSLLEQDSISLFYCNSRKAILNPHQPQAKQSFAESLLGHFSSEKGQYCVAKKAGSSRFLRSRKAGVLTPYEGGARGAHRLYAHRALGEK